MPSYPIVTFKHKHACICLPGDPQVNDILHIYTAKKRLDLQFNTLQIDALLNNPDAIIRIETYYISYDSENKVLFVESAMRSNNLNYIYLERVMTSRYTPAKLIPPVPYQMRVGLDKYTLENNDIIEWSINGIGYSVKIDNTIKTAVSSSSGYTTPDGHNVKQVHTVYMGDHIYVTAAKMSDIFTADMVYTNAATLTQLRSSFRISPVGSKLVFENFYDIVRENDIIDYYTSSTNSSIVLGSRDIDDINLFSKLIYTDVTITVQKLYKGNLTLHELTIQSNDPTGLILSIGSYMQPTAELKFPQTRLIIEKQDYTSDPSFDTPFELTCYSKAELDHIKGRCICSFAGILKTLKELKIQQSTQTPTTIPFYTPAQFQAKRDYIMDYKVYPCVCNIKDKQYLWDNYGPFTSPKPVDLPKVSSANPYTGATGVSTKDPLTIDFTDVVKFGNGSILLMPVVDIVLNSSNINDGISTDSTLSLEYPMDITLGSGTISLSSS